jgi:hypothetical protein
MCRPLAIRVREINFVYLLLFKREIIYIWGLCNRASLSYESKRTNLMQLYRMSQEEWARLRESVPYFKVYRYNPKHLYPKLNGCGDNGQRSLKFWQLLHTYWLPDPY